MDIRNSLVHRELMNPLQHIAVIHQSVQPKSSGKSVLCQRNNF